MRNQHFRVGVFLARPVHFGPSFRPFGTRTDTLLIIIRLSFVCFGIFKRLMLKLHWSDLLWNVYTNFTIKVSPQIEPMSMERISISGSLDHFGG